MRTFLFGSINLLALCFGNAAQGSFITGSEATPSLPATVDLTVNGTTDWAKYSTATGNSTFTDKSPGSGAISDASGVTGNFGGNSTQNVSLTWSGGTPTASGTSLSGVTSNSAGTGLGFTVVANGQTQELTVYVGNYQTNAILTASLLGATSYVDSFSSTNAGDLLSRTYTLDFKADTAGDLLTVNFARASSVDSNSTLVLDGASLATLSAPEPTSGVLMLLGMGSIWLLRRRRA